MNHHYITGGSGSGKTTLLKVLAENAAIQGVPCVLVDHHGDVCTMLLENNNLSPVEQKIAIEFRQKCEIRVFGFGHGINLNLSPFNSLYNNPDNLEIDHLSRTIVNLLELGDKVEFDAVGVLTNVLLQIAKEQIRINSFEELAVLLKKLYDGHKDNTTKKIISDMFRRLCFLDAGVYQSLTQKGVRFSPKVWQKSPNGKTPISIIYIANFNVSVMGFIITLITKYMLDWMKHINKGVDRIIYALDEIAPYVPPHPKNPPPKEILHRISADGRKFGVGVILATQNPREVDYKTIGQCKNWWIGALEGPQNTTFMAKTLPEEFGPRIKRLLVGQFIYMNSFLRINKIIRVRNTVRGHYKPMQEDEIKNSVPVLLEYRKVFMKIQKQAISIIPKSNGVFIFCLACKRKIPLRSKICPYCKNSVKRSFSLTRLSYQ